MEPETLYRKLQQHLDRMPVGFPATESGVEIRILRQLFTPDEAELVFQASAIPEPAATIHRRVKGGMTLAEVTNRLEQMAGKGLILRIRTERAALRQADFRRRVLRAPTEAADAGARTGLPRVSARRLPAGLPQKKTTQMRIVPVNKTIPIERNVATYAGLRPYVESHGGPFAAMDCICRHGKELEGEKCLQTSLRENCLTLGVAAREMVRIGQARSITREEMLDLLDAADKEGLVLQPENTKNPLFVCCCCGCCCGVLTSAKRFPQPAEYFGSSFQAEVDADLCDSCGVCQSRCQMDALLDGDGGWEGAGGPGEMHRVRPVRNYVSIGRAPVGRKRTTEGAAGRHARALYATPSGTLWSLGDGQTGRKKTAWHEVLSAPASVLC